MSFVNLLPEDYVARRAQRRANTLCMSLFGMVMAGVIGAAIISHQGLSTTRQVYERVNASYADAEKLIEQMQALEQAKQRMLSKARLTGGLLERVPRSYLLAAVANALPEGASLTEFEFATRRLETTVLSKGAKSQFDQAAANRNAGVQRSTRVAVTLTIVGLAGTDVEVARFIAAMARCPLTETVDLVYSQEKKFKEALVREFRVVMQIKPGADVLEEPPEEARAPAGLPSAGPPGSAGGEAL